jgi:hypothetical protein
VLISNSFSLSMFPILCTVMNSDFQQEGYADAVVSEEFLTALKAGRHGSVAIAYFEWSSATD